MPKAELVHLIKRLSVLMNQHIDDVLKKHDIARSQFQILYLINKSKSITQRELLEILKVEPATLSGLVDTLESKGFVKRTLALDKRSKKLKLSPAGQKAITNIPHPGVLIETTMMKGIRTSDKKLFKQIINRVIENLESQ